MSDLQDSRLVDPAPRERKPDWLKVRAPGGDNYARLKQTLRKLDLFTVCEEARCPNVGECWGAGTVTVMLLGHMCTRGCRFCAVTTGNPRGAVDPREPGHVGRAIASLGLRYVVLTMVDRDDLLDGGASHMARAVESLRRHQPDLLVETLVGDFGGRHPDLDVMIDAAPDVFAHNIEVTRALTPAIRDHRCGYDRSLEVLRYAKQRAPGRFVKSSVMVGLGETDDEVEETMVDLRAAGVDIVTLGQYLRPTPRHAPVDRYVEPERFAAYERAGYAMGFSFVASGPLVRSSYHAAEGFVQARLRPVERAPGADVPAAHAPLDRHAGSARGPGLLPAEVLPGRRWHYCLSRPLTRGGSSARLSLSLSPPGVTHMAVVDESLLNKVASKLGESPTYADDSVKGSLLTVAAASYGSKPTGDDETQPTGFDPEAAALFEAVVESAYLVAHADGEFDVTEQEAFQHVVLSACADRVAEPQVKALLADLADQLEEDGVDKRITMVARAIHRPDHAQEVLRMAALLAHVSGGVCAEERTVLEKLASEFKLDQQAFQRALDEAESVLSD